MTLEWVRQQLLRTGTQAALGRRTSRRHGRAPVMFTAAAATSDVGPTAPPRKSAYVIAERMVPSGCSCVLVGRRAPPPAARRDASAPAPSATPSASSRRRVVLPGVAPGTVLRTRASVVEWVHRSQQLPPPTEYTVLLRGGRRAPLHTTEAALPTLPCQAAATNTCMRCPWMALASGSGGGGDDQGARAKQACWRASVHDALRNVCAAAARDGDAAAVTHTTLAQQCCFLEPYISTIAPNRLQGLQLFFQNESSSLTTSSANTAATATTTAAAVPMVHVRREGTSHTTAATPWFIAAGEADPVRGCLLESLEQKRLVPALQLWAAQLPMSAQMHLCGALVSQPAATATRSRGGGGGGAAAAAVDSHSCAPTVLQVVLAVERCSDVLGWQSPLCGPSHPADLLSTEEQRLVEAVTTAAPLVDDIEVMVLVLDSSSRAASAAAAGPEAVADTARVHRLYPALRRDETLLDFRSDAWQDAVNAGAKESATARGRRTRAAPSVRCWCPPLKRELTAPLPRCHAALCAAPLSWVADRRHGRPRSSRSAAPPTAASPTLAALPPPLPSVPTFWRHPGALDACCSVLLCILLDGIASSSFTTAAAASEAPACRPARIDVLTSSVPPQRYVSTTAADAGAVSGQGLLDGALRLLAKEASRSLAADAALASGAAASDEAMSGSPSPRHAFVSVRDGDEVTTSAAIKLVREALSSPSARPVRLCLYECTSTMLPTALSRQLATMLHDVQRAGRAMSVDAGVVDVDPLSSSFVAYACATLPV
ncbi:hypothetical protein NESM_000512700 [Novymonas esmeraldas]|uniref:Uncharacterized protein n=1 Tax=Novymonas esmeraldas TaxID=1808958 RepID=A0AAW0EQL3_9TRYP